MVGIGAFRVFLRRLGLKVGFKELLLEPKLLNRGLRLD